MGKGRQMSASVAPAVRRRGSLATACRVCGLETSRSCTHCGGTAAGLAAAAVPCGAGLAASRAGCVGRLVPALCHGIAYCAARRMPMPMRWMAPVPGNRRAWSAPGVRAWSRDGGARCLTWPMRLTTTAIRTATALGVADARDPARVTSGWAARADTTAACVLMARVIARVGNACQFLERKKFVIVRWVVRRPEPGGGWGGEFRVRRRVSPRLDPIATRTAVP